MQRRQHHNMIWVLLLLLGYPLWSVPWLSVIRAQTLPSSQPVSQGFTQITMGALHRHGGVPPGWQFTLPEGEAAAGRQTFIDMRCYTCHTITGEQLPSVTPAERSPGPDLAGMGAQHPAAYFAESILNPNAVVVLGPGYTTADGLSIMPTEYVNLLTVRQLLDLVAYLQSLRTPPPQQHHGSDAHTHQPPALPPHQGGGHPPHTPAK